MNIAKRAIINILNQINKLQWIIYLKAYDRKIYLPDKAYIKLQYRLKMGRKLNLKNPQTFNEKLNWLKYYYHNPLQTQLVDKYEVRKYIKERFGDENLVKCYGIYDNWDDIDFSLLPDQFVVKCTHDSGSVYICKDKRTFEYDKCKERILKGLNRNAFYLAREWPYKNVKPRIIIEEYIHDERIDDLIDYKFLCFNGEPRRLYTISHREEKVNGPREDYFDLSWNHLSIRHIYDNSIVPPTKPKNFERMIECAKILSKGLPLVRVDFYEANGKMYFGEMTFFASGGKCPFTPESVDYEMGEWITLPPVMR